VSESDCNKITFEFKILPPLAIF
jgi:hypothetical protein